MLTFCINYPFNPSHMHLVFVPMLYLCQDILHVPTDSDVMIQQLSPFSFSFLLVTCVM